MPDFNKAVDPDRLTQFTRRLIQTPSLSREEEAISKVIQAEMEALGYDEVYTDELFNVVGIMKGDEPGPRLLFNGHIDHAGVGEMPDAFSGAIIDGAPYGYDREVIYGRGASDMKAGVAAMVHAGAAARGLGFPRRGELIVTCVSREEIAQGEGIGHLLKNGLTADFAVSGEATGLKVYLGHRGKFEMRLTTQGRTTHGGFPSGGVNAIYKMNKVLNALQQDYELPEHPVLGPATVTVLDINASPGALSPIVPDRCNLIVDRRFLPEETQDGLLAGFQELLDAIKARDPEFKATLEPLKWFPAMLTEPGEPVVQAMLRARETVMGQAGEVGNWYFGVDGTFISQAGIPCVGFGPGNEFLAHTPGDVVPVDQVITACQVYTALIADLCGTKAEK
ncbi:MAG: M20/M25/M40 family metallo-hydrolase [Desulfarculus sp.]|nr:M20/M25/M40 family metallo-hydrolase [Pseudomonadota bacterium]MBV1717872.1 M20/M25/M40 family metallo-hydrolase [Desulfarculus sp.]MBU4576275.1 M20/M25/M40 family metallo-hydrolase [Pseudomonadota bacterium]MBU4597417.1 M20/M25/M40 family metallo-hydrolase [Pseudomonadota bacterium]MBV1737797.1 M20/M25/M40 family metallo-hydrolase [Desulfarculus sp.]